jgi:DNA-binding NarL/FixJ family response regulator
MGRALEARVRRVLIVDDHPLVRSGLQDMLRRETGLEVCGVADDVAGALRGVATTRPDVVIVDLSLRGGSGLDLIKQVRAQHPYVTLLVASMHDSLDFVDRALAAGASGFVSKLEPAETIIEAVQGVLSGRLYVSPGISEQMELRSAGSARRAGAPVTETLSDRELEVFEEIGRGRSTRQIAEALHRSVKTIETHRANIKRKLGLANGTELLHRSWAWVAEVSTSTE